MNILEVLEKARKLIEDPARWCKYSTALTKEGHSTNPNSGNAVKWCATGALYKVTAMYVYEHCVILDRDILSRAKNRLIAAIEANLECRYPLGLTHFNDESMTTHEDILEMFDNAISIEKEKSRISQ